MNILLNPQSRRAAQILALFALICIAAVSLVYLGAKNRINAAQTAAELALYRELVPDLPLDSTLLARSQARQLGSHTVQYLHAADTHFIRATTAKGYSGDITLLIAIAGDNRTLRGVRVLAHKETPGLGDKIEPRIHPWIHGFAGKTLENTRFAVKKDGGDFDAFSGATITPRAVVNLTGDILRDWQENPPTAP